MTDSQDTPPVAHRRIRSYVIRAGRMTVGQERAWNECWPTYGVNYAADRLDLDALFGRSAQRMLEIGFGNGDAILAFAQRHPDFDCIGIEVHPPGVGHLMLSARAAQLTNIRALCHDAVEVLTHCIAPASLDQVHVFFPDPWHKKRHHKRRLVTNEFVRLLVSVLKPNGVIKMATDWEHYAEQMLAVLSANTELQNLAPLHPECHSGFAVRPEHRPLTRFERRGHRLGHGVWDLTFQKK